MTLERFIWKDGDVQVLEESVSFASVSIGIGLARVFVPAHERMMDGRLVHVDSYVREIDPAMLALERAAGRAKFFLDEPQREEMTTLVRKLLDRPKTRVRISMTPQAAVGVLDRGRYIPATEEPDIAEDQGYRDDEAAVLREMYQDPPYTKDDPVTPVFGYVAEERSEPRFGSVQIVLKPSVKKRTAVYFGDVLEDKWGGANPAAQFWGEADYRSVPTGVLDKLRRAKTVDNIQPYVEAQVHGTVTIDDIERVFVAPLKTQSEIDDAETLGHLEEVARVQIANVALRYRLDQLGIPWEEWDAWHPYHAPD